MRFHSRKSKTSFRFVVVFLALVLPSLLVAQESHFQNKLNSSGGQFTVDLSSVETAKGATITLTNSGGSTISMPWIVPGGVRPTLSARSIVDALKADTSSDEAFAISSWQFLLDRSVNSCSAGSSYDKWGYTMNPIRLLYGYGIACCDQHANVAAWLWSTAGYQTRIVDLPGFHTIPEIYYGGAWHMLDPNHRVFYRNPDGSIASVAQIIANPSIVANTADANGLDPVGWSAQTMADLYASHTPLYSQPIFVAPAPSEITLAPRESLKLRDQNSSSTAIYYNLHAYILSPTAFAGAVFRRPIFYTDSNWAQIADSYSNVNTSVTSTGRTALLNTGTDGFVVYRKSSPFPVSWLKISGEFLAADTKSSVSAMFSPDGTHWSSPIALPLSSPASSILSNATFGQLALGTYVYYVKIAFHGDAPGTVGAYELNIRAGVQVAPQQFPALVAGQPNVLEYHDLSPVQQNRLVNVDVAIPQARPEITGMTAESLIPESPTSSTARNYQARRLVDDDTTTLAYPGGPNLDYVIHLNALYHIKQVSLWWGQYGFGPYVRNWTLYGRGEGQAWQTLSFGISPGAISDIAVNADVSDLRVVASSSSWIGLYEVKAYGDQIQPPAPDTNFTVVSNIPENPIYSLQAGHGASKLIDGNTKSLAYPASTALDYIVDLGGPSYLNDLAVTWGYFGTNPAYISDWSISSRSATTDWSTLVIGGSPGATLTNIPVNTSATQLRLVAHSMGNWIGAYELGIAASKPLTPQSVVSSLGDLDENKYPSSNLIDGNTSTLAYPGGPGVDYELDFGADTYIDFVNLTWGYFGADPRYISSWTLWGQKDGDPEWMPIISEGNPGTSASTVSVKRVFRKLRLSAVGANWIGVYEMQTYGAPLASSAGSQYLPSRAQ